MIRAFGGFLCVAALLAVSQFTLYGDTSRGRRPSFGLAMEPMRAEQLFEQLAGYANELGLLGEEIDTANGQQLGNYPQAYSHIGLITAAYQIDKARGRV